MIVADSELGEPPAKKPKNQCAGKTLVVGPFSRQRRRARFIARERKADTGAVTGRTDRATCDMTTAEMLDGFLQHFRGGGRSTVSSIRSLERLDRRTRTDDAVCADRQRPCTGGCRTRST